tara:strand:- start:439 stop:1050 length:612 start_codon:yes stop_codon:yes gene_type:complete
VVDADGEQVGIMKTEQALALAKRHSLDLVEISPNARPPVCRICDFGKYQYEESKKKKDSKKNSHAGKVKEVQLRPRCEQHDFDFKLAHATNFLCQDMKVKIHLRFRGRENAHKDIGFDTVNRFMESLKPWGKSDAQPRLAGRGIDALVNPLPKNQRAENPHAKTKLRELEEEPSQDSDNGKSTDKGGLNTPFANLDSTKKDLT